MAALLGVAALPIMRLADPPTHAKGPRISSLDGLRGFLALSVFFHHAAISHTYWLTGQWAPPPSRFYELLGEVGVSTFFMITAYLFWTKLIEEHGRPNWIRLYVGRVFRIGPVYWVAICCMLLLVAVKTNFRLQQPLIQVLRQVAGWLALGVLRPYDVNRYAGTNQLLAGVTWSLSYEWLFYFSLIFSAFVIRRKIDDLWFSIAVSIAVTTYLIRHAHGVLPASPPSVCAQFFLLGMTCASLEKRRLLPKMPGWLSSSLALALVATVFLSYNSVYSAAPPLLLGVAFFLIISGCDIFGLLSSIPARRLGDISYGIYLLQGLLFTCLLSLQPLRVFFLSSAQNYWLTVMGSAILLVVASTFVHVYVENPGIQTGRRVSRALLARSSGRVSSA